MPENPLAVDTKKLTKKFDGFTAVDGIDFYIEKGEIFGLLGPNGAGKTTTIRMLCGIVRPTSGSASVLGWDIVRDAEKIKANIGYMSQKFALYNDLTAVENIEFYTSIYNVPHEIRRERIKELIGIAGLSGLEKTQVRNLSGAWRQRLALACAITHKPPMLFLDEATAGVDPISRREFWDLIYGMASNGVGVLATTHYMDEAEYCNKVGMILDGKIITIASPETLKDNLTGHLAVIDCDKPQLAEQVLEKNQDILSVSIHGVVIHALLTRKDARKNIMEALKTAGVKAMNFEFIQPSLEDVFIGLVEKQQMEQTSQGRPKET